MGYPSLQMINSVLYFFNGYFHILFVENGMPGDHWSFCICNKQQVVITKEK